MVEMLLAIIMIAVQCFKWGFWDSALWSCTSIYGMPTRNGCLWELCFRGALQII